MTNSSLIPIDGSLGEGGGQILRTALGLSMVTGQPFRIENIRARRPKPGLLRQHLTAVNAAAAICAAIVDGAAIGSQALAFTPGKVSAGEYTFSVGSAGSTTLVLQTVLPALLTADGPSLLTLEGGTHNPHAPPLDFLAKAFLPLVNRMGPTVTVELERAGFYPVGGGRIIVSIEPAPRRGPAQAPKLSPVHLPERGTVTRRLAKALVAALPVAIAQRELAKVKQSLGWTDEQLQVQQLPGEWGPGNVLTLEVESDQVTEVFTGFGVKGVSAEDVAHEAVRQCQGYLAAGVPVGPFLADQLMLPIALAGAGSFATLALTQHAVTNMEVIQRFLPVRISVSEIRENGWVVAIQG